MSDFSPSLNGVEIKSPTEDGKLAFVMNTMVPRRLDQFDSIMTDLEKKDFNTDKAFFYVNFQAGDFCGRSYKFPLSKLNEFVTKSLLLGTNGKDPVIKFDRNFYIDEDNKIHLVIRDTDPHADPSDEPSPLEQRFQEVFDRIASGDAMSQAGISEVRTLAENLEAWKAGKFIIKGSGDVLNAEGLPVPKGDGEEDEYGVHVTYDFDDPACPIVGQDEMTGLPIKGPVITVDHDARIPDSWTAQYDVGGVAAGQSFPKGFSLMTLVELILKGQPQIDNILWFSLSDKKPVEGDIWTDPDWHWVSAVMTAEQIINGTVHDQDVESLKPYVVVKPFTGKLRPRYQYMMMAMPKSMYDGHTSTGDVTPLGLKEVYSKDAQDYPWNINDGAIEPDDTITPIWIYPKENAQEKNIAVFCIPVSTGDIDVCFEFKERS